MWGCLTVVCSLHGKERNALRYIRERYYGMVPWKPSLVSAYCCAVAEVWAYRSWCTKSTTVCECSTLQTADVFS